MSEVKVSRSSAADEDVHQSPLVSRDVADLGDRRQDESEQITDGPKISEETPQTQEVLVEVLEETRVLAIGTVMVSLVPVHTHETIDSSTHKERLGEGGECIVSRITDHKTGQKSLLFEAKPGKEDRLKRRASILEKLGKRAGFLTLKSYNPDTHEMTCEDEGNLPLMETLPGKSSEQRMAFVGQLAESLNIMHKDLGVLHRDLFPNQFYVNVPEEGGHQLILTDFGCAQAEDDQDLVFENSLMEANADAQDAQFNAHFASTDVARGLPYTAQSELQVFALISTWILTGDVPTGVREDLTQWMTQQKQSDELLGLCNALTRAASRRPEDRQASMKELIDEMGTRPALTNQSVLFLLETPRLIMDDASRNLEFFEFFSQEWKEAPLSKDQEKKFNSILSNFIWNSQKEDAQGHTDDACPTAEERVLFFQVIKAAHPSSYLMKRINLSDTAHYLDRKQNDTNNVLAVCEAAITANGYGVLRDGMMGDCVNPFNRVLKELKDKIDSSLIGVDKNRLEKELKLIEDFFMRHVKASAVYSIARKWKYKHLEGAHINAMQKAVEEMAVSENIDENDEELVALVDEFSKVTNLQFFLKALTNCGLVRTAARYAVQHSRSKKNISGSIQPPSYDVLNPVILGTIESAQNDASLSKTSFQIGRKRRNWGRKLYIKDTPYDEALADLVDESLRSTTNLRDYPGTHDRHLDSGFLTFCDSVLTFYYQTNQNGDRLELGRFQENIKLLQEKLRLFEREYTSSLAAFTDISSRTYFDMSGNLYSLQSLLQKHC